MITSMLTPTDQWRMRRMERMTVEQGTRPTEAAITILLTPATVAIMKITNTAAIAVTASLTINRMAVTTTRPLRTAPPSIIMIITTITAAVPN
jgi:hypothetical protein